MDQETAEKILKETEAGYDLISGKFSQTRKYFWRGLEFIADYAKDGNKVLDFGCGNGRLLELFADKNIDYYGSDVSEKLIDLAQQKYASACFSKTNPSQTSLAFTNEFFNTVYSIAVFHHFPSKKYREDIAKELYRVTKKDGRIIITVWNLYQKRYIRNILCNWKNKIFRKSSLDWNDCYISFTDNQGKKFQRFHHAFMKRELKKLFSSAGFEMERCVVINNRNIVFIGRKS
ncbi:MAG TPA: methyltransferase domain-containing protein [Candidatus Moranbacteria bacterium]|nr:methyltransferase domain-containing protein [Candidatus Moranbacteria bacterium]HSA08443.1 methyltransferase domain-containing protein [Candidatus Moranbacteria bacterium]